METACQKITIHAEKYLSTTYLKPSNPFTIQKFLYCLFSASHDAFKARVFRNNAIPSRIYLL